MVSVFFRDCGSGLLAALLMLLASGLQAQDPVYSVIDKTVGLPENEVYGITQDKRGFLWFTTYDGLCRYDGFEFKKFQGEQQLVRAGSQPKEDRFGRVWYINFDGNLFFLAHHTLQTLPLKGAPAYGEYTLTDTHLWYISSDSLYAFDLKTLNLVYQKKFTGSGLGDGSNGQFAFFSYDDKPSIQCINSKFETTELNDVRLQRGVKLLTAANSKRFFLYQNDPNAPKKILVFVGNKGLNQAIDLPNQAVIVQKICYTADEKLWLGTPKGVYAFDLKANTFLNNGKPYFEAKSISEVFLDKEGNYWFGTTNEGLLFVPDFDSKTLPLPSQKMHRLAQTANSLVIATKDDAIYSLDKKNISAPKLLFSSKKGHEIGYLHLDTLCKSLLFADNIFNLFRTPQQKNTEINLAIKSITRVDSVYLAYAASGICGLINYPIQGATRSVWNEMVEKEAKNELKTTFFTRTITMIRGKSVAFRAGDTSVFYATNQGIFRLTPTSLTKIERNDPLFAPTYLLMLGSRVIGLTSLGKLFEITPKNRIETLDLGIKEPIKIVRQYGNSMVAMTTESWYLFRESDKQATPLAGFNRIDNIIDFAIDNQYLYSLTNTALSAFPFNALRIETAHPAFFINYIEQDGKEYEADSLPTFRYNENDIKINYSILSFHTHNHTPLYYRLNGGRWLLLSKNTRTLALASLQPNEYLVDFSFDRNKIVHALNFTISPPWWQKTSVVIAAIASLLGFVGWYVRQQMRLAQQRSEEEAARNQLELERSELEAALRNSILHSIKAQMNPHFFYNALNAIQSYIYTNDKRNASIFLNKFSKLTRMILEFSEKEIITLHEELEALQLYLDIEQVRFDKGDFEYTITTDPHLDTEMRRMPAMIVQPYVENAVKHGLWSKKGLKRLSIDIAQPQNDLLVITIDDNGIGRKRAAELGAIREARHQSFATKANQTRIDILNRGTQNISVVFTDKIDTQQQALGTTVRLTIRSEA